MYLFHLHNSLAPYIVIQGTFSDSLHMIKCCVSFYSILLWGRGSRNEAISDVSEHSTTQSPGGKGSGTPSPILGQQVLESGHKASVTKQQDYLYKATICCVLVSHPFFGTHFASQLLPLLCILQSRALYTLVLLIYMWILNYSAYCETTE